MTKYKVIDKFQDKDTDVVHNKGDSYEHESAERITFLINQGYLAKEEASENPEFPKHTGGGYFELSNGEKVKGKDEAVAAEEELQKSGE